MTVRQSFNDFLNSGSGPSTPRGRGRGRGRGGGNDFGGRGGFRGTPRGRGGSFRTDYSNVPFSYDRVESHGYASLSGYNVAPFGPDTTASPGPSRGRGRGRGEFTPRGSGRGGGRGGRGGRGGAPAGETPYGSGSATPVTGLGYKRDDKHHGKHPRHGLGSTVGKGIGSGDVIWGGRGAPLFVKAGELFKDGEVDVITLDQDKHVHVDVWPMSDPSAPQMAHLQDEFEIDLRDQMRAQESETQSPEEESQSSPTEDDTGDQAVDSQPLEIDNGSPAEPLSLDEQVVVVETSTAAMDISDTADTAQLLPDESQPVADSDLFFIDTEPSTEASALDYSAHAAAPLGTVGSDVIEEEEIVFAPRTFSQPEPISVPVAAPTAVTSTTSAPLPTNVFMDPRARTRKAKKMAKKEKKRGAAKARKRVREELFDSDIEWGSDGPPPEILGVEALELRGDERDVEVLRDYLAGTMLNARMEREEEREEDDGEDFRDEDGGDDDDLEAMSRFGEGVSRLGIGADVVIEGEADDSEASSVSASGDEADKRGRHTSEELSGSDWDSESSSELGDLEAILDLDDSDDEEIEKEVDALFSGKDTWTSETDWFIRSMEEALDGGAMSQNRQDRNRVFRAIEGGDFDDFFPTEPAKKSKKKNKDLIPAQLQAQWEKDRLTKKAKKEQRQLERLFAELNPHPATHKGKKAKGKGKSKAAQASLAHLIPASASEVADMFDVSSGEEADLAPQGRMGRMRNLLLPETLEQVALDLREFIVDEEKTTYSLPPMDKETRKKVHMLAEAFGLVSKSRGSGHQRFIAMIKTSRSGRSIDEFKIERLVSASAFGGGAFYKALYSKKGKGKGKEAGRKGPPGDRGNAARPREGELVGEGAEKIGTDNIGHRLLSKMGWAEGDRIGRTGGLDVPIVAIVKNTKMGLGAFR